MKTSSRRTKFLTVAAAVSLLAVGTALAHEGEMHTAGSGLFGLPPEYVHVLLNPLPVYGLAAGILALGAALLARNKAAQVIALGLVIIAAASAWPVALYGKSAYQDIRGKADGVGQQSLDKHMGRAEKSIYIFYAAALLGVAALTAQGKFPKAATPLALATLIAGAASLGAGGWISRAGGQIRHPEFRGASAPSTNAVPHEHGAPAQSHEKTPPQKAGEHKHGETAGPSAEQIPMPETPEGILKAIHAYHGELASAVNAKKFSAVQSGAKTIGALAKKLIEVAPPDRKPVVESGVTKINQALDELRSSAETGSDSVMKTRLKEFEQALEQLEPQLKKP